MKRKTGYKAEQGLKRGPLPEGGSASLSKICKIIDVKTLNSTFYPYPSFVNVKA
jgi:hypothetical protein